MSLTSKIYGVRQVLETNWAWLVLQRNMSHPVSKSNVLVLQFKVHKSQKSIHLFGYETKGELKNNIAHVINCS